MINFSDNTVFNLKPIEEKDVQKDVTNLFVDGERILGAYKTIRDQVIFTNKRIITVDVQGITGKRKDYSTLPYSKLQYFSVQTPGFAELIPDCEMELFFTNGFVAKFEFKGNCNIIELGKTISQYVL
ncbi:MAG: PH domain-containing protein [Eubacterium sp.]|nr:PH domain-containing protein [Eubacterium sp.]DAY65856.1 MAG TPA: Bacterial PH domain protein [Caudoviricetes sp.]